MGRGISPSSGEWSSSTAQGRDLDLILPARDGMQLFVPHVLHDECVRKGSHEWVWGHDHRMVLLSLVYLHYSNPSLLAPKRAEPQGHSMEEQGSHDHSDVGGSQLPGELWRSADLHSTNDLRCDQVHFALYQCNCFEINFG